MESLNTIAHWVLPVAIGLAVVIMLAYVVFTLTASQVFSKQVFCPSRNHAVAQVLFEDETHDPARYKRVIDCSLMPTPLIACDQSCLDSKAEH